MLENTLESTLDCKEIQPVYSEGDQSWVFIGRTDAEAETPVCFIYTPNNRYIVKYTEKAMAPHSSTLAWEIPWMEEPGRLQSMGSLRVLYD